MKTTAEGVLKAPSQCCCYHNYCFYLLLICPHKRSRGQNHWVEVHPIASEKPQLQTCRKKNGRFATLGRQFLKIIMKKKKRTAFQNLTSGIKVLIMSVWGLWPFCRMDHFQRWTQLQKWKTRTRAMKKLSRKKDETILKLEDWKSS